MKHILCLSIVLTLGINLLLLTLQEFQAKLANIITPVLIISDISFLISAILFDILYLPLFLEYNINNYNIFDQLSKD